MPRKGQSLLNFLALLTKPRMLLAFVTAGTHCPLKFSKPFTRPWALFHRAAPSQTIPGEPRGSSLFLGQDCGFVPAEFHEIAVSPLLQGRPLHCSPCSWHVGSVTGSPPPSEPSQPFLHCTVVNPFLVPCHGYQNVVEDGVSQPLCDSMKTLAKDQVNDIHCCPLTHQSNHHCS